MRYVKGTQELIGKVPDGQSWNNLIKKISKGVLDYNLKYKKNIQGSMLVEKK